jgi:hypothetical protein
VFRVFGLNVAHAGDEFHGPGLRRVFRFFYMGWSGLHSSFGPKSRKGFLKFLKFFFSGKTE